MTEEVKVEGEQQSGIQSDPVQEQALAQGWVPKEEFQGEPHKWVEAGEFLRRGELFSKIDSQSKELKAVKQALFNFQEHHTKLKETEYNRALADLKAKMKAANRAQEFEVADEIESQIQEVQAEAQAYKQEVSKVTAEAEAVHPEFAAWVERNNWYATQRHMRTFADEEGAKFRQAGLSPREVLKKVEEVVRKEFPTKFTNPNRERPSAVEGSTTRAPSKKEEYQLTEQETRVMNSFINQKDKSGKPFMTKEEYIADLKRIKGVK